MKAHKKSRLYDVSQIRWNDMMFSKQSLRQLLFPLMLQQLLSSFMGMADTMMVSRVGSAAISAVSLVDSINVLMIELLSALATGGTIICSQYLGHRDRKRANEAARQVLVTVLMISVPVGLICFLFRRPILSVIFGTVEQTVMDDGVAYFFYTSISFPFIALFETGAAFFRADGNSRLPMIISIICNGMNIVGNAFFIFGLQMGTGGAALSTLISRIASTVIIFYFLKKPKQSIVIDHYLSIRPDPPMIRRVLSIGLPSGVENSMFQFGKLVIQSSVSTLTTTQIAANAMVIVMENLNGIAGIGIGIGLMTVVGQCIGADRTEEAKYYIVKVTEFGWLVVLASCIIVYVLCRPIMTIAGMEPEAAAQCFDMMTFVTIVKPIIWVFAFIPPYGMRAAGDVKFSMITSSLTMWFCRVLMTTLLIRVFGFGPIAVWIGMASDWLCRGIIYSARFISGKWLRHKVI